jgi:CHAD domain-containing protein
MATAMPIHQPAQKRPRRTRSARRRRVVADSPPTVTDTGPRILRGDPVSRAVMVSLETALLRIRGAEAEARTGDVDGVHRLRTSTRRLRSELRAFRAVVESEWLGPIEGEMKWLAGLLGGVRDLDVLIARLHKAADEDGLSDSGALAPLFDDLMARHAQASADLRSGLEGDRYRELLAAIERAIDRPLLGGSADVPCRKAMPPLAASVWRRLKRCGRGLRPSDPDEAFHEVRKRAKRARYTAEMVALILSGSAAKGAHRFIRGTTRVQDVLGEHQDAVVAGHEVASILARHSDDRAFQQAAHLLLDGLAEAAREARKAFFDVWDRLDRKKCRRWLKTVPKTRTAAESDS